MSDAKAPAPQEDRWWDSCPVCGARLVSHKCRLVCSNPRRQYFQSCSEFDL